MTTTPALYLQTASDGPETRFHLPPGPVTVGRAEANDIRLTDPSVADFHARLEPGSDGWTLIGLDPDGRILHNGAPVRRAALRNGDQLQLGDVRLRFALPAPDPPAKSPADEPAPDDWLSRLAQRLAILTPLIGHDVPEEYRERRGRIYTALTLIGIFFSALGWLADVLDVAQKALRPVALSLRYLPLLAGLLLLIGGGFALWNLLRPGGALSRRNASGLLAAVAFAGLGWGGWNVLESARVRDGYVIAVAEFEQQTEKQGNPTGEIYVAMEKAFDGLGEQVAVERTLRSYDSAASARADAAQRGATLIIWGWYTDDGITSFIEVPDLRLRREEPAPTVAISGFGLAALGLNRSSAPSVPLSHYSRTPLQVPDAISFRTQDLEQMTAAAAAVLGTGFYLNGDYAQALKLLNRAVNDLPPDPAPAAGGPVGGATIFFQRGTLLWELGRRQEAIADLRQATALDPTLPDAHYNLAIALSSGCPTPNELGAAVAAAQQAADLRLEDAATLQLLGELQQRSGQLDRAVAAFQRATELAPEDGRGWLWLGQAQQAAGNPAAAEASWQRAIQLLGQQAAAAGSGAFANSDTAYRLYTALGDAHLAAEQYAEAHTAYETAHEIAQAQASEAPGPAWGLANVAVAQEDWPAAAAAYARVLELAPDDPGALTLLGIAQERIGESDAARDSLQAAVAVSDCDPGPALVLGGVQLLAEEHEAALQSFQRGLALAPEDSAQRGDIHYFLGMTYRGLGRLDDAAQALLSAAEILPDEPVTLRALVLTLAEQERWAELVPYARRLAELDGEDPLVWGRLGLAHAVAQDWQASAEAYRSALARQEDIWWRIGLATAQRMQNEPEAALAALEQAELSDEPTDAQAAFYRELALNYEQLQQTEQALEAYAQAFALTGDPLLQSAMGTLYAMLGDQQAAIDAYSQAAAANPDDWLSRYALGDLHRFAGELAPARSWYEEALALEGVSPDVAAWAQYGLGEIAYRQCRVADAVAQMEGATAQNPSSNWLARLARFYEMQGRAEEAAGVYQQLVAAPPTDGLAHLWVGEYYLRQQQLDAAQEAFQRVADPQISGGSLASLAHYFQALLHLVDGRQIPAQASAERAVELWPQNAYALMLLGDLAAAEGATEQALGHYAGAEATLPLLRANSEDPDGIDQTAVELMTHRSLVLAQAGQPAAAQAQADAALALAEEMAARLPRNPQAHLAGWLAYTAAGEPAPAQAAFALAAQCDPTLPQARQWLERQLALLAPPQQ